MKYLGIFTALIFLASCSTEETATDEPKQAATTDKTPTDLQSRATAHIKGQLNLTAADKFDTTWYSHDITGDGKDDYIITVNLMDRAINESIQSNQEEKMQELGYMGYYNHFFFIDGTTEEISDAVVVASSPMFHLKVQFEEILGTGKSDFYVDYRVRNMQRRKFYSIASGKTKEVSQAIIFDGLGTSNTVAYDVRIEKGTLNDFNDIVEYEAQLEDTIIRNIDSTYSYQPTITPTDRLIRRWHFSPGQGKYFTLKQ